MDFGGYDLAQWSAVDGRLHRPEQRVSLRIMSPAYVFSFLILCASNLWAPECYYTGSEFLVCILWSSVFIEILILYLIGLVRGLQHGLSRGAAQPQSSIFSAILPGPCIAKYSCSQPFFWPNLPLELPGLSRTSAWSLRLPPPITTM